MADSAAVDIGTYAVVLALLAGTVRALVLWRAAIGVDVVNVVVLQTLAEGHGGNLEKVLRGSGSALYLAVAGAIGRAALELQARGSEPLDTRQQLEQAAQRAILQAGSRLRKTAWLDVVALAGIGYAGIDAFTRHSASPFNPVALVAATLLWLANLRSARHIATRTYAGASALIESLALLRETSTTATG